MWANLQILSCFICHCAMPSIHPSIHPSNFKHHLLTSKRNQKTNHSHRGVWYLFYYSLFSVPLYISIYFLWGKKVFSLYSLLNCYVLLCLVDGMVKNGIVKAKFRTFKYRWASSTIQMMILLSKSSCLLSAYHNGSRWKAGGITKKEKKGINRERR